MRAQLPLLILLLVLMPLVLSLTAQAQPAASKNGALMTGRTLGLLCASDKTEDRFNCQSYIAGMVDYHRLIKGLGTAPGVDFCTPADTTMDQMRQIVAQYMMRHTEHQDFIAAPGVAMALFTAFPCKKR